MLWTAPPPASRCAMIAVLSGTTCGANDQNGGAKQPCSSITKKDRYRQIAVLPLIAAFQDSRDSTSR
ncbi:hypothetical protein EOS93_01330 [Rhizobium sp. RMa-01]|nr:hypothetical protein EOS93_01330 [Rhizobium sp. RMa-01]